MGRSIGLLEWLLLLLTYFQDSSPISDRQSRGRVPHIAYAGECAKTPTHPHAAGRRKERDRMREERGREGGREQDIMMRMPAKEGGREGRKEGRVKAA